MIENTEQDGALTFFKAQHRTFAATLAQRRGRDDLVPALLAQAYSSFEGNVEVQAQRACRSHAFYDKHTCVEAAAGRADGIPLSVPHMMVRSLIQNAMQSALRDAGYVWAAYELNHALCIALADEGCEAAWLAGADIFAPALVTEISLDEMANTFDRIHAGSE